ADKLDYAFPGRTPRPLGVAGQIIPWNFPLLMAAWKLAPALACGNTCVLKPAETTSITAMHLAEIFQQAELPDGVVNIVTGAGETGRALVDHPKIDKIAFTGSTEVGKRILKSVAGSKKKLTLELGGKAANIIFEDAPIDQAIEGIISGIYFNQGHVCCAGSRLFVQEEIFGPVLSVMTFRTPEEAIERANNTPYGLSAGVWTDKGSKIFKIVNKLRAGVVWANTYNKFDPTSPFGGYKESGFGREGG